MDWRKLAHWLNQEDIGEWQAEAPLSAHTSWKIGGPARLVCKPGGEAQCRALLAYCSREGFPVRFLGLGTNLLVSDAGVEALVLHTGGLQQIRWETDGPDRAVVEAGAGLPLANLSAGAAELGYQGLAFAIGIPGSFGGALVMNAGANGAQISDDLLSVRTMDRQGQIRTWAKEELNYGYRSSDLRAADLLVLSGKLRLSRGDREKTQALMSEYLTARRRKQPLDLPNAGSVFRNPEGAQAGLLIDQAGLKGLQTGMAMISPHHANFIVNLGGAKAGDVRALMETAQSEVRSRFGFELESEIVYWDS